MAYLEQEVLFKFELAGVSKFFKKKNNGRHSDRFWCRGLQWSIYVSCNLKNDRSKHLGFYLWCHNDQMSNWSCTVHCKFILFSLNDSDDSDDSDYSDDESENLDDELDYTFEKEGAEGYEYFISYSELTDKANGYIENDKIMLGVELKAELVIRKD